MNKFLKNKNPYLIASAAIVVVSFLIIFFLLRGEDPEEVKDVIVIEETVVSEEVEEVVTNSVEVSETEETPSIEADSREAAEESVSVESTIAEVTKEEIQELEEEKGSIEKQKTPESTIEETDHDEKKEEEPEEVPEIQPEVIPEKAPELEEVPADPIQPEIHVHSWAFESYYQEPTCSNGGLVNQICVHCGETQISAGTPTGEHLYEVETPGDCCSAEVVVCMECNFREVREKDMKNHIDVEDGFCYGCGQKVN